MAGQRVGIKDVAAAAGVSPTAVSHAFSGARPLTAATKERILRVAAELGYSPDPRARGLRTARSYTIGFLSDQITSTPHAGRIVAGAQEAAAAHDSVVVSLDMAGSAEREERQIRALRAQRVDGFVYARMFHQVVEVPEGLRGERLVFADALPSDRSVSAVVPDEYAIGATGARVLLEAGHRRVGFSTIADDVPASVGRERGFRETLAAAGVPVDESLISRTSADTEGGRQSGAALLGRSDRATAIFCFNDEVAMGVYQAAATLGLSVPHDVSVVGVDDLQIISTGLLPTLTTVALPHFEMGQWAVERLFAEEADATLGPVEYAVPCQLIVRDSVASLR